MHVRRATEADAPGFAAVMAVVAAEDRYLLTEPPVEPEAMAARFRALLASDRPDVMFVLVDAPPSTDVVGVLGLHPTSTTGVRSLGMALVPAARGQGGGRALVAAALDAARTQGAHKVELEVFPDNARAVALYARCGFVVEGLRREHHVRRDGSRRDVLLMARLLA